MPQLDFASFPSQMFWIVLILAVQCFFFFRVLPIFSKILASRSDRVNAQLKVAKDLMKKAQELKQEYEVKILEVRKESAERLSSAISDFQNIADQKARELDTSLLDEFKNHQDRVEEITQKMDKNLTDLAVLTATDLIKRISNQKVVKRDLERYIN